MRQNVLETIVGALVLLLSGGILGYAYIHTSGTGPSGYALKAKFQRIDGLLVGSDVKISGIKVGEVTGQSLDPKTYEALVTFQVSPTVQLAKDSSASVASESLLGGKYLDVQPGGDDASLKAGDVITHTQSSVNMESLIGQMIFSQKNTQGNDSSKTPTPDKK